MDYLVLLGILIVIVGFALKLDAILIIFAAAIVTALVGGIGAPFVLAFGANPAVVGVLALTCGYCGTLLTPMAANFNIVPVALLEMKDRMGVIRNQILPALVMISAGRSCTCSSQVDRRGSQAHRRQSHSNNQPHLNVLRRQIWQRYW